MKIARKDDPLQWQSLRNEIGIMQRLGQHSHLSPLLGFEMTAEALVVATECYERSLLDSICTGGRLEANQAACYTKHLLQAIAHCHLKSVVHRDVKLEHCMIRNRRESTSQLVVIDMGVSVVLNEDQGELQLNGAYGSPEYMAPEVIGGTGYGREADLWSAGICLYACLSGFLPFSATTSEEIFRNVTNHPVPFPSVIWDEIDPAARNLCEMLLVKDPSRRISAASALQHPWVLSASRVDTSTRTGSDACTRSQRAK